MYSSMVERWPFKPRVLGSSPSAPSYEKVAEWFKAADCKSVGIPVAGSNPVLLIFLFLRPSSSWFRMLLFHSKNKGSNPLGRIFN